MEPPYHHSVNELETVDTVSVEAELDAVYLAHVRHFRDRILAEHGREPTEYELLTEDARMAWESSSECPARSLRDTLQVIDGRECRTAQDMYDVILRHMVEAFNGDGKNLKSIVSLFPNNMRVLNKGVLNYAGYNYAGVTRGDVSNIGLTEQATAMGWQGTGGDFDLLPLLIKVDDTVELFEIPKEHDGRTVYEIIKLSHPDPVENAWIQEAGLEYYSTPMVTTRSLERPMHPELTAIFSGYLQTDEVSAGQLRPDRSAMMHRLGAMKYREQIETNGNFLTNYSSWMEAVAAAIDLAAEYSYGQQRIKMVSVMQGSRMLVGFEESVRENSGWGPATNYAYLRPNGGPVYMTDWYYTRRDTNKDKEAPLGMPRYRRVDEQPTMLEQARRRVERGLALTAVHSPGMCPVPHGWKHRRPPSDVS